MREEPDSLCATFINLELPSTDLDEGVFDAMDKFIENAKLAGALGFRGHEHVARLTEEVADFERGADATMSKNRAGGAKASEIAKANEWEEPLTDDSQR